MPSIREFNAKISFAYLEHVNRQRTPPLAPPERANARVELEQIAVRWASNSIADDLTVREVAACMRANTVDQGRTAFSIHQQEALSINLDWPDFAVRQFANRK
jgi:hypothetical protein